MGGFVENPTYKQVCYENTGHTETLEVKFNNLRITFKTLAKLFFEIHDPTQLNRQGPDIGEQYRSAIFYSNEEQKAISLNLINILKEKGIYAVTQIIPATVFWEAEEEHQKYYLYKGQKPYCHFRKFIF